MQAARLPGRGCRARQGGRYNQIDKSAGDGIIGAAVATGNRPLTRPVVLNPSGLKQVVMSASRPLRIPTAAQIRRTYVKRQSPIPALRQFMATIAPMVNDRFITYTIASAVSYIGPMRGERKTKHLNDLMGDVPFPKDVAREIYQVIDQVTVPPEYVRDIDRLVPPLENLAGAVAEPQDAGLRPTYDDVMAAFDANRAHLVRELSQALVGFGVAHESNRESYLNNLVEKIPTRIRYIDQVGEICNSILTNPSTWQDRTIAPAQVITMQSQSKARDDEAQELIDTYSEISPERYVLGTVDEMIMDSCERAINARSRELQPFAFWQEVAQKALAQV